jgi:hypothetical protein
VPNWLGAEAAETKVRGVSGIIWNFGVKIYLHLSMNHPDD